MPQMPAPNSGGAPEPNNNPRMGKSPAGAPAMGGGQIKISRIEELALIALETSGDDPKEALDRAMEDSGLKREQIEALRDRADKLRRKGYTLVGAMATLKPKSGDEDHALINDRDGDGIPDDEDEDEEGEETNLGAEEDEEVEEAERAAVLQAIGVPLREVWSDAARAAALAARAAKASGKDWRKAGRTAYAQHDAGRDAHAASTNKAYRAYENEVRRNVPKAQLVDRAGAVSTWRTPADAQKSEGRLGRRALAKDSRYGSFTKKDDPGFQKAARATSRARKIHRANMRAIPLVPE